MGFSQTVVDDYMAKCGRHCCICRRFAPLHLQVHHIVEKADGGADDAENAIPICLTCHSDAHTDTKLTRRFAVGELEQHRDLTFRLVEEGKLRAPQHPIQSHQIVTSAVIAAPTLHNQLPTLSPQAVTMLIVSAQNDGDLMVLENVRGGMVVKSKNIVIDQGLSGREAAIYLHAKNQLLSVVYAEVLNSQYGIMRLTYQGFLAADAYIAAGLKS